MHSVQCSMHRDGASGAPGWGGEGKGEVGTCLLRICNVGSEWALWHAPGWCTPTVRRVDLCCAAIAPIILAHPADMRGTHTERQGPQRETNMEKQEWIEWAMRAFELTREEAEELNRALEA